MSPERGRELIGPGIAGVLRYGTAVAIASIGVGYVLALIGGDPGTGPRSALDLLSRGGPPMLMTAGLLILTLIPVVMLVVAAVGFASLRERRTAWASLLAVVLLVGALGTAVLVAIAG